MKHFFKKIMFAASGFAIFLAKPALAAFPTPSDLVPCSGAGCDWCSVFKLLQTVFNTAEIIVFPLIVIYIIYGAVTYIISSITGSEEGLSKARATVTDAIIGLVIILLTFVIVNATLIGIAGSSATVESFVNLNCSDINNTYFQQSQ